MISVKGGPRLAACAHARTGVVRIAYLPHSHTLSSVGAVPNDLAGGGGALRSRCMLTPAIHGILLPAQRGCSSPLSHPLATPLCVMGVKSCIHTNPGNLVNFISCCHTVATEALRSFQQIMRQE